MPVTRSQTLRERAKTKGVYKDIYGQLHIFPDEGEIPGEKLVLCGKCIIKHINLFGQPSFDPKQPQECALTNYRFIHRVYNDEKESHTNVYQSFHFESLYIGCEYISSDHPVYSVIFDKHEKGGQYLIQIQNQYNQGFEFTPVLGPSALQWVRDIIKVSQRQK